MSLAALSTCLVLAGCSFDPNGADLAGDGAVVTADAATADAPRSSPDAAPDARVPDAAIDPLDAAIADAAPPDAARPDATPPDAALPPDASMPLNCPNGYVHGMNRNADHCYRFVGTTKSWQAAEADCENDNTMGMSPPKAHLIVFSNEAEFNDVRTALNGQQIWIGADDIASEGNFVNVTGGAFITTHFRPGEPNDTGPLNASEDCVLLVIDAMAGFNDAVCATNHAFLCELDGASPL
jgi:hypothetical protein